MNTQEHFCQPKLAGKMTPHAHPPQDMTEIPVIEATSTTGTWMKTAGIGWEDTPDATTAAVTLQKLAHGTELTGINIGHIGLDKVGPQERMYEYLDSLLCCPAVSYHKMVAGAVTQPPVPQPPFRGSKRLGNIVEDYMGSFPIFLIFRITDFTKNITPVVNDTQDSNLVQYHAEILNLIRRITRAVLTPSIFNLVYPGKDSFTIDWQGFYDDLPDRLLLDAFRRWLHWAFERSPTLPSPNEQEVKIDEFPREDLKRQAAELYPDSDDEGEDGDTSTGGNTKPAPKKLKKDAYTLFPPHVAPSRYTDFRPMLAICACVPHLAKAPLHHTIAWACSTQTRRSAA
ncbi:hypothetical protein B0H14DRAFT_3737466 [Mycena olivaceomarginata]|nr:hypothetical protein B0H14DRAFT_3737466 [Mycena olivaceomarginata]